jgi:hypothetical protein
MCWEIHRPYFKHRDVFKIHDKIGLIFKFFKDFVSKTVYVEASETRRCVVVDKFEYI